MFDLQVLAYQADVTRVTTFLTGQEFTMRTYPEIGVPDAFHSLSHHQENPEKLEKLAKIDTYHTSLFAYFLDKLKATPDGDGSLLDHAMILYGGGLSDGNVHAHVNLPLLIAGGAAGAIKGGRVIHVSEGHADGEPAGDPGQQDGRAARRNRRQHRATSGSGEHAVHQPVSPGSYPRIGARCATRPQRPRA